MLFFTDKTAVKNYLFANGNIEIILTPLFAIYRGLVFTYFIGSTKCSALVPKALYHLT
jgi:hypothetical protein